MSIKKIQQTTGFSYSTISRVLNGKSREFRISETTRLAILEAAQALDYRPNMLARGLRLKRSFTIGLIVSDIQNPFFGGLASRIEKLLRERGYSTILCNANEIPDNEEFYLKVLYDRQVDGILLAPVHIQEWGAMAEIRRLRPIVLLDRVFPGSDIPWVTSANEPAAQQMTAEILEAGCRDVAFLGGMRDTYINTMRFSGFRKALAAKGLIPDERLVLFEGYSSEAGEKMMSAVIRRKPDIQAVVCVNNLVFLGAMRAAQKHEAETGRSILMAAFDIDRYCDFFRSPLICARQDQDKLAFNAVSLLVDGIHNVQTPNVHRIVPMTLRKHRMP